MSNGSGFVYLRGAFWTAALERAVKSAGQGAFVAWPTAALTDLGQLVTVAQATGFAAGTMFVASLLTSVASARLGSDEGPSLIGEQLAERSS